MKTMLFISNILYVTHWRISIQRCISCLCQDFSFFVPHSYPLFIRIHSLFRKYISGFMMFTTWLSLPMRDYSFSIFIFVKAGDAQISCTQVVSFSISSNTHIDRFWISQPRQVLSSEIWTSPASLWSEKGSSYFRGLSECSGLNMVCVTKKAIFWHAPPSMVC